MGKLTYMLHKFLCSFLFDFLKNWVLYYIVDKLLSDFSRFVSYYTMNNEAPFDGFKNYG